MAKFNDYMMAVGESAAQFQYLEEALKMYLASCFKIIHDSVNGKITFTYTYSDVAKKPLGQLITIFKKFNNNKVLHRLLRHLKNERNHIAHRAYLLTVEKMRDKQTLTKEIDRLNKVNGVVDAVLNQLHKLEKKLEEVAVGRNGET
jgi:hypothetical protein